MKVDIRRLAAEVSAVLLLMGLIIPYLFYLAARGLDNLLGFAPLTTRPTASILAAASFVAGLFWILWSYSYLLFVGKGSPVEVFGRALSPTKQLVTVGPYAFTRNPMVLGYLFILLGIAFLFRSPSGVVVVPVLALAAVAYLELYEEPELVRRFGRKYEHYREHVPVLLPKWRVYIKPESVAQV